MLTRTRVGAYAVITHAGSVLLTKLAAGPSVGAWGLPGGGIEHGESPGQALQRELREEIGFVPDGPHLLTTVTARSRWTRPSGDEEDVHYIGIIYRCELPTLVEPREGGDGGSCGGAQWFVAAELASLPISPPTHDALVSAGLLPHPA